MTPIESDCSSPNGQPMAATGAPTVRRSAWSPAAAAAGQARRVDLQQRDVGEGVEPDDLRGDLVAVLEAHEDLPAALRIERALRRSVTTWALVAISPSPSSTKPEPEAAPAARPTPPAGAR